MASFKAERERMVANQIAERGIVDERILKAMRRVPRHLFLPEGVRHRAYQDSPVAIGEGQTISQPYIVALMTSLLEVEVGHKVLDVGTGSGYQAAVLAELGADVHSIERHPRLAKQAEARLHHLGYDSVQVHVGDGTQGLEAFGPYDGIIVAAAAPSVPEPLLDQLAEGGRLVIPVGSRFAQTLEVWKKVGGKFQREAQGGVVFVPLVGKHGWENA
jgi:protein-L-isoaspartate(D-aspartate) O-methyltransferase